MKLSFEGIRDKSNWKQIRLPAYDAVTASEEGKAHPVWAHFGIGNIFRVFLGGIADDLLESGDLKGGITAVETFDFDIVDRIYRPFDNLILSVILHEDGREEKKVLASVAEAVKGCAQDAPSWLRLREVFASDTLQFVSFTITEKGYALRDSSGAFFPVVKKDLENGPSSPVHAMSILTAMLVERFHAGAAPLALVSMDNCAHNGSLLRDAVLAVAGAWKDAGFVGDDFLRYVSDENRVAFPWTMIDKITPRPSQEVAQRLKDAGVEDMDPVLTSKRTYIAPFVNAEGPQYLVIEDHFPNGRPPLEKGKGVYLTDRETVNRAERMKVTACLNPIHTALGPAGVVLGYDLFSDEMQDPDMLTLARQVGYAEGLPVAPNPGILSPKAFLDECMLHRFPNPYLGDTCLRLCTDASQGLGVRFGVTIRAYMEKDGTAASLKGIPLAIALWLRYMLAVDDKGRPYELAPDPLNEEVMELFRDIRFGDPSTVTHQLESILSNEHIFTVNLYSAGIGEKITRLFKSSIAGEGALRSTIQEEIASW